MFPDRNLPWWRHDRPWGFRFSTTDGLIFLGGVMVTVGLWFAIGAFALIVPYLLGHFFLFCNTFRVGGERSLIWAGSLLLNAYFWPQSQNIWIHLAIQLLITFALIIQCVLGKNYHGIACVRINPQRYRSGALSEGAFTRRVLIACRVPKPMIEQLIGRRLDEFDTLSK
jgi:hypothetical protein